MHRLAASLAAVLVPMLPCTQGVSPSPSAQPTAQREVDLHNYLVMRLRLLKRGAAVEELKSEIVNQIDFATVSPPSVEFLRRMMSLCDRAIAGQAKLGEQLAALDQQEEKADTKAATGLGGALLGLTPGGLLATALAILPNLESGSEISSKKAHLQAQGAAELGADISTLEFDLAILASRVQSEGRLKPTEFVRADDYDAFLAAAALPAEKDRISGVLAALERSPRLQPAALFLASHFASKGEKEQCSRYAQVVVDTSPRILRHDALRAQAYVLKANLLISGHDNKAGVEAADLGLQDDPASASLLFAKAIGLALTGEHAAAQPIFEKLALLVPNAPLVHYNLACCQAVAAKNADAALASFRQALACGFSEIAVAKNDADLELLREQRNAEFEALTTIRLGLVMKWNLINPDELVVTNESAFTLVHMDLLATVKGATQGVGGAPKAWIAERKATLDGIAPGKSVRVALVDTTREAFRELRVAATGAQGRFEAVRSLKELEPR